MNNNNRMTNYCFEITNSFLTLAPMNKVLSPFKIPLLSCFYMSEWILKLPLSIESILLKRYSLWGMAMELFPMPKDVVSIKYNLFNEHSFSSKKILLPYQEIPNAHFHYPLPKNFKTTVFTWNQTQGSMLMGILSLLSCSLLQEWITADFMSRILVITSTMS